MPSFAVIFLAAGLMAQAAPDVAVPSPTAPSASVSKPHGSRGPRAFETVIKGPKGEELICKTYQPVGSRLPIRACRTAYDGAELNAASLRGMDQMIGHGTYP